MSGSIDMIPDEVVSKEIAERTRKKKKLRQYVPSLIGGPKIVEETSELCQALMKAAYRTPNAPTKELMRNIEDEIADSYAALDTFCAIYGNPKMVDGINIERLNARRIKKARKNIDRHNQGDLNGLIDE
jgi:NTP pyrophosphatase (non-canonical NTP hydrolase)